MAKRNAVVWTAVLVSLGLALIIGLVRPGSGPAPAGAAASPEPATRSQQLTPPTAGAPTLAAVAAAADAPADPEFVAHLRSRYGARIDNAYVQLKMLEHLIRHFQKISPEHWKELLLATVRAAFPERYAEIAANLERRIEYERWAKESQARLRDLDPEARRRAIWDERYRLFGPAADEIWASELKGQAVAEALKTIDAQRGAGVGEKLALFKQGLEDIYQEQYDSFLKNHQHEAMNRFLSLDSVQAELGEMRPEAREKSLREIRKGLGLDEEALKRWETLDHERDSRWEDGKSYMAERQALASRYEGAELEKKLAELRERFFGSEAEVVAAEEESGFFRYDRPRRWGQN